MEIDIYAQGLNSNQNQTTIKLKTITYMRDSNHNELFFEMDEDGTIRTVAAAFVLGRHSRFQHAVVFDFCNEFKEFENLIAPQISASVNIRRLKPVEQPDSSKVRLFFTTLRPIVKSVIVGDCKN